jgi:hypothetical protein
MTTAAPSLRKSRPILSQDAEKVREPDVYIWSIWFLRLCETNEMDQITRQTGLVTGMQAIEGLLY